MKIKLIETVYQNNAPVAWQVVNNYTYQAWWREIKLLQAQQERGILDYEDVLDLDKGECERKVYL